MRHHHRSRGFTLVELAFVVAIVATLGALAYFSVGRLRPRAELASSAAELQSLLHGARQQALATGHPVAVLFFPDFANGDGQGRVIVYEDGQYDFFTAGAAVNFDAYNPATPAHAGPSEVVATFDLPRGIRLGPLDGMGSSAVLTAPWDGIDVTQACSFCTTTGARRGAVVFDPRGRASFYSQNGPRMAVQKGGSVTIHAPELGSASRTLVITSSTGAVRAYING
jgi:prepilin-type N-terminal cleavage/methylation domain-containing protein